MGNSDSQEEPAQTFKREMVLKDLEYVGRIEMRGFKPFYKNNATLYQSRIVVLEQELVTEPGKIKDIIKTLTIYKKEFNSHFVNALDYQLGTLDVSLY